MAARSMRLVGRGDGRWVSLPGVMTGRMAMRVELAVATEGLANGAARWEDAYRSWEGCATDS